MRMFWRLLASCGLLLTLCRADVWDDFADKIVSKHSQGPSGQVVILGRKCDFPSTPVYRHSKLRWNAKLSCPGWSSVTGESIGKKNRKEAIEEAAYDFVRKLRIYGIVSVDQVKAYVQDLSKREVSHNPRPRPRPVDLQKRYSPRPRPRPISQAKRYAARPRPRPVSRAKRYAPRPRPRPISQAKRYAPRPRPRPVSQAKRYAPRPRPRPISQAKRYAPRPRPRPISQAKRYAPRPRPRPISQA